MNKQILGLVAGIETRPARYSQEVTNTTGRAIYRHKRAVLPIAFSGFYVGGLNPIVAKASFRIPFPPVYWGQIDEAP